MTAFDFSDIEAFLDCHPDLFEEYLVRKAKCDQVSRWLKEHQPSKVSSVEEKRGAAMDPLWPTSADGLRRRSSHMELRRNFARSKATTAHWTYDEHVSLSEHESQSSMRRRALLRKASSLPPTTAHILSALLESRVNVPQYASSAIDYKYRLKETNEREFFLELVKDISNELDLTNLSYKILINVCILVDADRCSLFLVEGPPHKRTLVSKFFDVHSGTTVRPSSSTLNSNEVQVPWGKGIIGYVAEHGETVNISNAYEVKCTPLWSIEFVFLIYVRPFKLADISTWWCRVLDPSFVVVKEKFLQYTSGFRSTFSYISKLKASTNVCLFQSNGTFLFWVLGIQVLAKLSHSSELQLRTSFRIRNAGYEIQKYKKYNSQRKGKPITIFFPHKLNLVLYARLEHHIIISSPWAAWETKETCDLLLQQHRYVPVRGTRVSLLIVKTVSTNRDSNLQAQESDLNAADALS